MLQRWHDGEFSRSFPSPSFFFFTHLTVDLPGSRVRAAAVHTQLQLLNCSTALKAMIAILMMDGLRLRTVARAHRFVSGLTRTQVRAMAAGILDNGRKRIIYISQRKSLMGVLFSRAGGRAAGGGREREVK